MEFPKYHCALWMAAGLCLAFTSGYWVAEKCEEEIKDKEIAVIEEAFQKAMREPDQYVSKYFQLMADDKYSKHSHANVMALVLSDAFSPDRSGAAYVRAMHAMDEENIKKYVSQTYDRFMEYDRAEYENFENDFPEEVERSIHTMFSNRPVFMFPPEENLALMNCMRSTYKYKGKSEWSIKSFLGLEEYTGCKALMKIHNNKNL